MNATHCCAATHYCLTRHLRRNMVDVIVKDDPQPVHLIFIAGISWTCVIVVSLVFSPKARFSASVSAAPLALPTADTFAMMFQVAFLCTQAHETDGLLLALATNKNDDVVVPCTRVESRCTVKAIF